MAGIDGPNIELGISISRGTGRGGRMKPAIEEAIVVGLKDSGAGHRAFGSERKVPVSPTFEFPFIDFLSRLLR